MGVSRIRIAALLAGVGLMAGAARGVTIPDANFDTLYKPGSTTITATSLGGGYTTGMGPNVTVNSGTATFSDNTTGTKVDVPEWTGGAATGVQDFPASSAQFPAGTDSLPFGVYAQGPTFGGAANNLITSASLGPVAAGTNYLLSIRVGWRNDVTTPASPVVLNLNANGTALTPDASASPTRVQGAFVTYTRTYNATSLTSFVGQPMTISFGVGASPSGQQAEFDSVSLTDSAVPEPASAAVIGLSSLLLLARRRRP